MIPLGNILSIVGCLGGLVMLPHMIKPAFMCKMFLAEKFTEDKTAEAQLVLLHFGLFSYLFFLAATIVVAGQTCPCLPVGYGFCVIVVTRLIQVFLAMRDELVGLSKKPVMMQVIVGVILVSVVLTATIMASSDAEYLASTAAMEATALAKMETAAPLVWFIIGVSLFFALITSAPGIFAAEKAMDGYIPSAMRLADKYARAQMKFYVSFTSREQFFLWLLIAAVVYMSPDITYICITLCVMALYFVGFFVYCVVNAGFYGFAWPPILLQLIIFCILFGGTMIGLLMM